LNLGPFGHAMEMRIYAEDTSAGFVPAPGVVHTLKFPTSDCRVESAVLEGNWRPPVFLFTDSSKFQFSVYSIFFIKSFVLTGDEVSVHYDPMIAKLVVWGDDRAEAIRKADLSLSNFNVGGVETNIDFMRRILQSKAFSTKLVTTKFIEENEEELLSKKILTPEQVAIATLVLSGIRDFNTCSTLVKRFRMNTGLTSQFGLKDGETNLPVSVSQQRDDENNLNRYTIGNVRNCQVLRVQKNGNTFDLELQVGDKIEKVTASLYEDVLTIFTSVGGDFD